MHLRYLICCCLNFLLMLPLLAPAQKIERKIIIQDGQFYFFTVDDETQLATLYTGSVSQRLNNAVKRPMPLGRMADEPQTPLCFDVDGNELTGINWILNSNNSRYEALKKIDLRDWKKARPEWTIEDWAQVSFDQPMLAPNDPWEQTMEENNILDHAFFDLVKTGEPIMAVSNQQKLSLYHYAGGAWRKQLSMPYALSSYFSLVPHKGTILLADATGNIYRMSDTGAELLTKSPDNKSRILVIDKDNHKNYTLARETIEAASFSTLQALILSDAQEITF